MDERALREYFAAQPKPELKPFLAPRVIADAKAKPRRSATRMLHLIWTMVLLLCLVVCNQVHLPLGTLVSPIVLLATFLFVRSRRSKSGVLT